MDTIEWVVAVFPIILYAFFSLLLSLHLARPEPISTGPTGSVSIIIAARNEAANILNCLESLSKLDYPSELLQIIVVNDRSEDATQELIANFIEGRPHFCYHQVTTAHPQLSGKASAISQVIPNATGEFLFITDADCVVPPQWVRQTMAYFDESVGVVAGFTLPHPAANVFERLQLMDAAYLLSVAAGSIRLGLPLTCMGNNFALRRQVYDEVGGYEGVGFSVTEDFALLKGIANRTRWKIAFSIHPQTLVRTQPTRGWRNFFSQRKRWTIGGRSVSWWGKLLVATSLAAWLSLFALIFFWPHYCAAIFAALAIWGSDYALLSISFKKLKQNTLSYYLILYKLFFWFYGAILALLLFCNQKIRWKGTEYIAH
ncbi:MAG: glycosyltransferase [candidate division KSB1 bacterium]|nr:glycosyltransferase [candidate division KSB1 bacterium]MDZ7341693.1 glycosyltransferase [candidate division KSB1 bacterium]